MAAFEDSGYYCVDNMPVVLLPEFLNLSIIKESRGVAFVMDIRERSFLDVYDSILKSLEKKGYKFEILFFEANENIILQRYSQTRRLHPLSGDRRLLESIRHEMAKLKPLRMAADRIIDTSEYNIHDLKLLIFELTKKKIDRIPMRINILSFGFKYGVPIDADIIMDVRFMINPYFDKELRPLDGKNRKIKEYVLKTEKSEIFLNKYIDLLIYLLPLYEKEGKAYLTIAIGCTGGRHRSVAVACHIFEKIKSFNPWVHITHRDMHKI